MMCIAQVSSLLGHADPGFTLRVHVSVLPADLPDGEALAAAVGLAYGEGGGGTSLFPIPAGLGTR